MTDNKLRSFLLPNEMADTLRALAYMTRKSQSYLVREAIAGLFSTYKKELEEAAKEEAEEKVEEEKTE